MVSIEGDRFLLMRSDCFFLLKIQKISLDKILHAIATSEIITTVKILLTFKNKEKFPIKLYLP